MNENTESVWRDEGPIMFSICEVWTKDVSSKIRTAIRERKADKSLRYSNLSLGLYLIYLLYTYLFIYIPY